MSLSRFHFPIYYLEEVLEYGNICTWGVNTSLGLNHGRLLLDRPSLQHNPPKHAHTCSLADYKGPI